MCEGLCATLGWWVGRVVRSLGGGCRATKIMHFTCCSLMVWPPDMLPSPLPHVFWCGLAVVFWWLWFLSKIYSPTIWEWIRVFKKFLSCSGTLGCLALYYSHPYNYRMKLLPQLVMPWRHCLPSLALQPLPSWSASKLRLTRDCWVLPCRYPIVSAWVGCTWTLVLLVW